jgi:hypothetical protein
VTRREIDAIRSLQRFAASFLPEPWDVRLLLEAGSEPARPYALVEQAGSSVITGSKNIQEVTVAYTLNLYLPRPVDDSRRAADDAALELRETVFQAVKWGPDLHNPTTDRIPLYAYDPRNEVQRVRVRGATSGTWRLKLTTPWTPTIAFDADIAAVQTALNVIEPGNTLVVKRGNGVFDIFFIGELAGKNVPLLTLDAASLVSPKPPTVTLMLQGAPAPWRSPSDFMRVLSFGQHTIRDPDEPVLMQVAVDLRCAFARTLPLPFDQMLLQRLYATGSIGG